MATKYYCEAVRVDGLWAFKIYHYDDSGNKEIVLKKHNGKYNTKEKALDAGVEWCEDNQIDAELVL